MSSERYEPLWRQQAERARPPRSPRGSDAIHGRLRETGRRLFIANGYRNTTTKQIVAEAQTTERTLFKHFGSKAGLFEATLVEPFSELVSEWATAFATYPEDRPLSDAIESWVDALVSFVTENRPLLKLLVAADFDGDETLKPVSERISAHFAAQIRQLADEAGARFVSGRHYNVDDPPIALAAGISMALGMVLLDGWVFPHATPAPDRRRIVREISSMVMHGISARPG